MTEYQRSRILSESPQHGPVLLAELDKAEAELAEEKNRTLSDPLLKRTLGSIIDERDLALAQLGEAREAFNDADNSLSTIDESWSAQSMKRIVESVIAKLRAADKRILSLTPSPRPTEGKPCVECGAYGNAKLEEA